MASRARLTAARAAVPVIAFVPAPARREVPGSKKTTSRHTTELAQGTHAFEIAGYSLKKGVGAGRFIRSAAFSVGGHDWAIRFYPDGFTEQHGDYIAVYLELLSRNCQVRAFYDLRLIHRGNNLPRSVCSESITPRLFTDTCCFAPRTPDFVLRDSLEIAESKYIMDDCLTIECVVTVVKESKVATTIGDSDIVVPPSDLSEHFGKLLLDEDKADVRFLVGGETFAAHKIVLATRSPVFEAELYGEMRESGIVSVEDIQPDVFRTLLNFIYTDELPADMGDLDPDVYSDMVRHLLVAADRYAMDRLRLLCESILGKTLRADTVTTTLVIADAHNCDMLKDVCIEFMATCSEIDAMVATPGYAYLKRTCPSILVDVLERANKIRRN